ncbi:MAG: hypothetical protein ACLPWS_05740 [Rhodomicrobium sp.]
MSRSSPTRLWVELLSALLVFAWTGSAEALECPEIGKGAVARLISPAQARVLAGGGAADLGNEINEIILRLKSERPGISFGDITNELIAVCCPLIDRTSLSAEAKRDRLSLNYSPGHQLSGDERGLIHWNHV